MRIGIVTVYNSPNFGSYWQARALYDKLCEQGHEVYLFDTGTRSTLDRIYKPAGLSAVKSILKINYRKASFQVKKMYYFWKNLHTVRVISEIEKLNRMDVVIFGSDEIWNVTRNEMSQYSIFWGDGIEVLKKISYAVSVNRATKKELEQSGMTKYLDSFVAVSVRDSWSKEQLEQFYYREIEKVIDPTLLYNWTYYSKRNRKICDNYIALYYSSVTENEKVLIKALSKRLGKKIISIGMWYDWCDECVISEIPFEYFEKADYVITNTFHGTDFSINYNKKFIAFVQDKTKIAELLNEFSLDSQIGDDLSIEDLLGRIESNINWEQVNQLLEEKRRFSIQYLSSSIGE